MSRVIDSRQRHYQRLSVRPCDVISVLTKYGICFLCLFRQVDETFKEKAAALPQPPVIYPPAAVIGPDGNPVIALVAPNGSYMKATVGTDGQLEPVLDQTGEPIIIKDRDGATATEVKDVFPEQIKPRAGTLPVQTAVGETAGEAASAAPVMQPKQMVRFVPTTVLGPQGEPVAALVGPDGVAVCAVVNPFGRTFLRPDRRRH